MIELEEIKSDAEKIIAIVVKREFERDGVNFVSKEDYPLQLGISSYKKGATVKAHFYRGLKCLKIQR